MHFGIFLEERRRGVSESATLRETIDLADTGEAQGLDGIWLGEIHFNGSRSIQSAPLAFASFLAARTRRLRIGIAVQVDRKSTRLNSSHVSLSRMPSSA